MILILFGPTLFGKRDFLLGKTSQTCWIPNAPPQVSPAARAALAHAPLSRTPESFSAQLLVNGIDKIKKKVQV